jgi:hypothetical protein
MCLEESFRAKFNQERARQGYTRWKKIQRNNSSYFNFNFLTSKVAS